MNLFLMKKVLFFYSSRYYFFEDFSDAKIMLTKLHIREKAEIKSNEASPRNNENRRLKIIRFEDSTNEI